VQKSRRPSIQNRFRPAFADLPGGRKPRPIDAPPQRTQCRSIRLDAAGNLHQGHDVSANRSLLGFLIGAYDGWPSRAAKGRFE
jgi:hypothetical protein